MRLPLLPSREMLRTPWMQRGRESQGVPRKKIRGSFLRHYISRDMATIFLIYALLSYCLYNNYTPLYLLYHLIIKQHENYYTHTHFFFFLL